MQLDKACYKKLFQARGKYDDVIAVINGKQAAEAAALSAASESSVEASGTPHPATPAAVEVAAAT